MSVMLPILSSLLLVMAVWGGLHTDSVRAERTLMSNTAKVTAYWQTMLPNTPMPLAILELLTPAYGNDAGVTKQDTGNIRAVEKETTEKTSAAQFLKARKLRLFRYGQDQKKDDQNFLFGYAQEQKKEDQSTYVQEQKKEDQNFLFSYAQEQKKEDQNTYGQEQKKEDQSKYGQEQKREDQNFLFGYAQEQKKENQNKYGQDQKKEDQNFLFSYALEQKKEDQNTYGQERKREDQNFLFGYAQEKKKEDQNKYGQDQKKEDQNFLFGYAQEQKKEDQNTYGQEKKREDQNFLFSYVQDDGHKGEGGHVHGGIFFSEDSVTPGSMITPHILPSFTSGASFLPRRIAESVPISTRNFTDIKAMFAPVSPAVAEDIWSALYLCDQRPEVKGETNTCVVSVESMVEFISSVLGATHGLRALSSPDVPAGGVKSGKSYKVKELRRVTGAGDTVTCHGLRFPSALFKCHAVNPTRVYSVTMERACADGADIGGPERLEALAVCHLDTSDFDPAKMPGHLKPGEAPLCHFLARDNVLWAPPAAATAAAA